MAVAADADELAGPGLALVGGDGARPLALHGGRRVDAAGFLADVRRVAAGLPERTHVVNLCAHRYAFMVGFAAAILRGQVSLLPASRAAGVVEATLALHPGGYALGDDHGPAPAGGLHRMPTLSGLHDRGSAFDVPRIPARQVVAVGFTSGSTGQPTAHAKTWGAFAQSNAGNAAALQAEVGAGASLVATVPPQHMYGLETSVLLPMLSGFAVHGGRPFFPADVRAALADCAAPRVLVSTPVHLRNLLAANLALPPLAAVVSATAPLPQALARRLEAAWGAPVLELFGSTETCVVAQRRSAHEDDWTLRDGAALHPQPDGAQVEAAWLDAPVLLQDLVELLPQGRFRLHGRSADLLEIAGKRASLTDLTRHLLAVPGVRDAVVFQHDVPDARGVCPVVALAVAPGLEPGAILEALRAWVDPVFLPRPLRLVQALPRNETGKLPRHALQAMIDRPGA